MDKEKVVIIGSGPSGLSASIYNARAGFSPLIIGGAPSGGQLMLTSEVENYPGFESILGPELISKMTEHAKSFGTRIINDNVSKVDFSDSSNLKLTLSSGTVVVAESVLVATGASALWLGIESETRLRGRGVSACATCDGFFFRDKIVGVVGGGDTAMEEALTLAKFASKVYVIHRRGEFRASKIMQTRVLENEKITVLWYTEVEEVLGEQKVEGLKLRYLEGNSVTGAETAQKIVGGDVLKVDGLFLAIGHKPNTEFLKDTGMLLNEKGYIVTSGWYAWGLKKGLNLPDVEFDYEYQYSTNIKGVFAAGDVVDYMYRQATTAVGFGVAASLEVERYLMSTPGVV